MYTKYSSVFVSARTALWAWGYWRGCKPVCIFGVISPPFQGGTYLNYTDTLRTLTLKRVPLTGLLRRRKFSGYIFVYMKGYLPLRRPTAGLSLLFFFFLYNHNNLCPHLPTLLSSQAANASRIMFTVRKRAQLVSTEVPLVAEITKGQWWGIKGPRKSAPSSAFSD